MLLYSRYRGAADFLPRTGMSPSVNTRRPPSSTVAKATAVAAAPPGSYLRGPKPRRNFQRMHFSGPVRARTLSLPAPFGEVDIPEYRCAGIWGSTIVLLLLPPVTIHEAVLETALVQLVERQLVGLEPVARSTKKCAILDHVWAASGLWFDVVNLKIVLGFRLPAALTTLSVPVYQETLSTSPSLSAKVCA